MRIVRNTEAKYVLMKDSTVSEKKVYFWRFDHDPLLNMAISTEYLFDEPECGGRCSRCRIDQICNDVKEVWENVNMDPSYEICVTGL